MADTSRIINVAVIDEAQMLADPDRGAAWTAAVMGVPAREVVVLGAPDCLPLVRRIAELCDEPVEVVRLERKNPLHVAADAGGPVCDHRRGCRGGVLPPGHLHLAGAVDDTGTKGRGHLRQPRPQGPPGGKPALPGG